MVTLDDLKEKLDDKEDTPFNEERAIAALLLGGARRRMRLRRLLVAELFGSLSEDDNDSDGDGSERGLLRLLVAGRRIHRGRLRRLLLTQLLRGGSEELDDDDSDDDDDGDDMRKLGKFLIGKRARRRNAMRKYGLSELLSN